MNLKTIIVTFVIILLNHCGGYQVGTQKSGSSLIGTIFKNYQQIFVFIPKL